MAVVTGGDHHGVAAGISQQGGDIGGGLAETKLAAHVHWTKTAGGSKGMEACAGFGEGRDEHAACIVSRSDHSKQGVGLNGEHADQQQGLQAGRFCADGDQ